MSRLVSLVSGLFAVAVLRGQATYWLARGAVAGTLRASQGDGRVRRAIRRWLDGPEIARGTRIIERWGLIAIPLCYLTIGVQTLVLAAAGLVRMRWVRFTAAQLPGALAWAIVYATIGLAAWSATVRAAAGNTAARWGLAGVVMVIAGLAWWRHKAAARARVAADL